MQEEKAYNTAHYFKRLLIFSLISGIIVAGLCTLSYFFVDRSVANWVFSYQVGGPLSAASIKIGTLFAPNHWLVVLGISALLTLVALIKSDYQPILRVCAPLALALLLAFCLGAALKFGIGRSRPSLYFMFGIYSFSPMNTLHSWHSMPSGHTLMAFAGLTALSFQWRILSWSLILLAICIGLSRVIVLSHFVGDIVLGAWVGTISAYWARALCAVICHWMSTRKARSLSSDAP